MTQLPCPNCGATWQHECWAVVDAWRSIWEAMALCDGFPPGAGMAAHVRTYGGAFNDTKPDTSA